MRRSAAPLVKICGVTTVDDALLAADLGAAMLGLNFHPPSPRCLSLGRAAEIAAVVRARHGEQVAIVGVFVDAALEAIAVADRAVGFDLVQLHGDEPAGAYAPAFGPRLLRALRVPAGGGALPDRDALAPWGEGWGFLFESYHPGAYGGTGVSWDYAALAAIDTGGRPFLVAGGVGPGTVGGALRACHAAGVDVCSRVEGSPGRKDPVLLRRLFEEVEDVVRQPGSR